MPRQIDRRTMLRGAGVAVALPALDCMTARVMAGQTQTSEKGPSEPRRMVAINFELSFHPH
ncbi:MAG: hypothetical protein J5I93_14435 [Pirellulaceae bacterium]|nr:hypothetical protein [Pirellulaceae bacterium]